jgi:TonB family protein
MRLKIAFSLLILLPAFAEVQGSSSSSGPQPLATYAPKPDYPLASRKLHHVGSGLYLLRLRSNGTVQSVEVLKSTSHPDLDQAAINAFSRWRFKPSTVRQVKLPMSFTATGASY